MITLKETKLEVVALKQDRWSKGYYWQTYNFISLKGANGESLYFVNGKETTKDEGNKKFLDLKKSNAEWLKKPESNDFIKRNNVAINDTFKVTVSTKHLTLDEVVRIWESKIDENVMYIDDHITWTAVSNRNAEIRNQVAKIESTFSEEEDNA